MLELLSWADEAGLLVEREGAIDLASHEQLPPEGDVRLARVPVDLREERLIVLVAGDPVAAQDDVAALELLHVTSNTISECAGSWPISVNRFRYSTCCMTPTTAWSGNRIARE